MTARNTLILFTDEHVAEATGCYGHPFVKTPNIDKLAADGIRFSKAWTPSPICVPARASLATGQYVHKHRNWSNAQAYDGGTPSWGHRLLGEGLRCASIGKLHFRSEDDDNGFDEEIIPIHVKDGLGWIRGLLREPGLQLLECQTYAEEIGPGEDQYSIYDRNVAAAAIEWIKKAAGSEKPWTLFVSFLRPHYPLTCPEEFFALYPDDVVDDPRLAGPGERHAHPVLEELQRQYNYDDYFTDETRRIARASYFGLISFVDDLMGQVLTALDDSGQRGNTNIVYTSDHGDCNGNHGFWTKCNMYEESLSVPMILAGPDVPAGKVVDTPASLLDIYPTVLQSAGIEPDERERVLPGTSLFDLAGGEVPDRVQFSEYHDGGSITGFFAIQHGKWKYVVYPGFAPQLFDTESDPFEAVDLAADPAYRPVLEECDGALRTLIDPDIVNDLAFSDQAQKIADLGGKDSILNKPNYDFTPVPSR